MSSSSTLEEADIYEEGYTLWEVATQPDRFPNSQAADKKLAADSAFLHSAVLLLREQQESIGAPYIPSAQFTVEESITGETSGKVAHWEGPPVPLKE